MADLNCVPTMYYTGLYTKTQPHRPAATSAGHSTPVYSEQLAGTDRE